MTSDIIRISQNDLTLIRVRLVLGGEPAAVALLQSELNRATIVDDLPDYVAGINSTVRVLDLESDEVEHYTLSLPEQADISMRRLSVLSPLGTAILGYAEGDEFAWPMPGGERRFRVLRVAQPRKGMKN